LPERQQPDTKIDPVKAAYKELDLWQPYLQRFQNGEQKFVHWSYWPSTVFTADAARDLVRLFSTDSQLQEIMHRSKIWATEEVILPTLVALLGYSIAASPCSYAYVKYRRAYTMSQVNSAMAQPDVFWIHPVPRRYDDPLRKQIRMRCRQYDQIHDVREPVMMTNASDVLLTLPILNQMKTIEGWLEEDEADLLIAASARALARQDERHTIVEVGSYCGRSTIVIGSVAKAICPDARLYAIDPHDGKVGALDQSTRTCGPTLEKFRRNIARADLAGIVEIVQKYSFDVVWEKPIALLFIDGLHDYVNVARDFFHFEAWMVPGGYVAFHDYADYYPGVQALVNEVLATQRYRYVARVRSMIVLEKLSNQVNQ
jgi:predicted O-methyltransferase YrrM